MYRERTFKKFAHDAAMRGAMTQARLTRFDDACSMTKPNLTDYLVEIDEWIEKK